MSTKGLTRGVVFAFAGLLGATAVQAQEQAARQRQMEAAGARFEPARQFYSKLSESQRDALSGSARNFFHVVNHWSELQRHVLAVAGASASRQPAAALPASPGGPEVGSSPGPVPVSDASTDFIYGPSSGFTNSETSTAWCGSHVVVGFNDSGSLFESLLATAFFDVSFNGFANSTNQGGSFTDEGFLPPSIAGNPTSTLAGDPTLVCADASTFYYSSIFFTVTSGFVAESAVSVSKSTDGGASFGAPTIAVAKSAATHTLDKPTMAIDPANPTHLAITYTDFDISGLVCGVGTERTAIEFVYSTNGGVTWSAPTEIVHVCSNFAFVQGSELAFSPGGAVDVAYESYPFGLTFGRFIEFTSAPSLGMAFGAPVTVAGLFGVGDSFEVEGGFRTFIDLQSIAVDRSGTATSGNIYLAWHDTDLGDSLGIFAGDFFYAYSDVRISKSTDGGADWSAPVDINSNSEPLKSGLGTDSFMPGIAVDNTSGEVAACWYDRRNDPRNFLVDRFCGRSFDAGATFTNFRMTDHSFAPIHGTDDNINPQYLGDYDGLASDGLKKTSGFIGAFQIVTPQGGTILVPAPNVFARSFN